MAAFMSTAFVADTFQSVVGRDLKTDGNTWESQTAASLTFFINDQTIQPDRRVARPWLSPTSQKPSYKLILTDIGWNHKNTEKGLEAIRSIRSRELLQGAVDHTNFDPTIQWTDVVTGQYVLDPEIRYYIFLDVETCFENNYPIYMASVDGSLANADLGGGRHSTRANLHPCYNLNECHYIFSVLDTVLKYQNTMLVVYDCRGWGPGMEFRNSLAVTRQLSLVSQSAHEDDQLRDIDQGLPPAPLNPTRLSSDEIESIHACHEVDRQFLVTFVGSPREGPREAMLRNMSNGRDVLILTENEFKELYPSMSYQDSLRKSVFGAAPRGDNLYSYRFTEVLSAGAIPVVHADEWVLPFHKALIDWNETCAVVIPESQVYETEHILRSMSNEERCRRQSNCIDFYQKYMATPQGTVEGIIDALELINQPLVTSPKQ